MIIHSQMMDEDAQKAVVFLNQVVCNMNLHQYAEHLIIFKHKSLGWCCDNYLFLSMDLVTERIS